VQWEKETPHFIHNYDTNGIYQLSRASKETKAGVHVSFGAGKLTDRRIAVGSPLANNAEKWVEIWQKPGEIEILFDLKADYTLTRMHIFFSGYLPLSSVDLSLNKLNWYKVAQNPSKEAGEDVHKATYLLDGSRSRYVKVKFSKSDSSKPLILVETEIWGKLGHPTFPLL
jgi:hypothetical protein